MTRHIVLETAMASEVFYDVLQVLFGAVLVIGLACDMYPAPELTLCSQS